MDRQGMRKFLDAANEQLAEELDARIEAIRDGLESRFTFMFSCGHSRDTRHKYTKTDMSDGWIGADAYCEKCREAVRITGIKAKEAEDYENRNYLQDSSCSRH